LLCSKRAKNPRSSILTFFYHPWTLSFFHHQKRKNSKMSLPVNSLLILKELIGSRDSLKLVALGRSKHLPSQTKTETKQNKTKQWNRNVAQAHSHRRTHPKQQNSHIQKQKTFTIFAASYNCKSVASKHSHGFSHKL